jgi:GT2 family glycosyltransferase
MQAVTATQATPPVEAALTVSVVLYQTPAAHIRACAASLAQFAQPMQVFWVDNSPTDALRRELPTGAAHQYLHQPDNPGFGAAHNVAIRRAQALGSAFHLVLNADVRFEDDVLSPMLAHMAAHPQVAHLMPMVRNPDGSVQRLCKLVPTPADLLLRRFTRGAAREANNRRFELHDSGYNRVLFVPYLSGCFMLLRMSALREVGGFDERFFVYGEDIDLSRRLAARYECQFFPSVEVVHEHAAASYRSLQMLAVHAVNVARYFNKWGWLRDAERDRLNHKTLAQLQSAD